MGTVQSKEGNFMESHRSYLKLSSLLAREALIIAFHPNRQIASIEECRRACELVLASSLVL